MCYFRMHQVFSSLRASHKILASTSKPIIRDAVNLQAGVSGLRLDLGEYRVRVSYPDPGSYVAVM